MTRRNKLLIAVAVPAVFVLLAPKFSKGIFSISVSYILPVDDKYIANEGEWIGDISGVISLHDKRDSLANHVVYREGRPIFKIKRLNKYFNELVAESLDSNAILPFTSSGEFCK